MRENVNVGGFFVKKVLAFLTIFSLFLYLVAAAQSLSVIMDKNYPPYSFLNSSGKPVGICVDLWNEWQKVTGVKVNISLVDWRDALTMIKEGKADAVDETFYSSERAKYLDFTKPFDEVKTVIFFDQHLSGISGIDSIKGFKVGVKLGDYDATYAFEHGINSLVYFSSYEEIVKAAKNGEIRIFIADEPGGMYYLEKYGLLDEFKESPPLYKSSLYRAVKRGRKDLVKLIDDGFDKIPKSEVESIMKKWKGVSLLLQFKKNFLGLLLVVIAIASIAIVIFAWNRTLSIMVKRKIKELEAEVKKEKEAKKSVSILSDKLSQVNDHLLKIKEKFENMIDLVLKLSPSSDEREFAKNILDIAIRFIPEADAGSISLIKEDKWKFLAIIGHDESKLMALDLKANWMVKVKSVEVIEAITEENVLIMPKEVAEKIAQASGEHIYRSLVAPIEINGKYAGNIFLDTFRNVRFSEESKYAMNMFGKLASSFFTMKRISTLEIDHQRELLRTIAHLMESSDPRTRGHSESVSNISVRIGKRMNLSLEQLDDLKWCAAFHDIGYIGISQEIRMKPDNLTAEEYELLKIHPLLSEQVLKISILPQRYGKIVKYHHERFDGKGYPDGLKGEEIPLLSRIIAVANAFDEMVKVKGMKAENAIEEIQKGSSTEFDPLVVKTSLDVFKEYISKMRK